jgi:RimJ/RimL family protein N-acetyltransferase
MSALDAWPLAPVLRTERLSLEPLAVHHADEMAPLLDDPPLFAFTGGSPSTLGELRQRYARQATTWSVDRQERWLNWVVREASRHEAIGYVQAGITVDGDTLVARLAWVIGTRHQRRGYAREAAGAMALWLREQGARTLTADIHPDHAASMTVARALGLNAGHHVLDSGEIRWTG